MSDATVYLSGQFPGELRKHGTYQFFLPGNIFLAKGIHLDPAIQKQLEETTLDLGRYSAKVTNIPNLDLFIGSYLKIEAVQSSRIEGTRTKIDEAFQPDAAQIDPEQRDDWQELTQYIIALNEAIKLRLKLPICNRFIKQIHKTLLSQNRGRHKLPGEYRQSQNWIGGSKPDNAHFVPPTAEIVPIAMGNLEQFIYDKTLQLPDLIKVALIHYQFETIHPFLDGNGRIGRMLIPLYLLEKKILDQPVLYISDFFEKNRRAYYDALDQARCGEAGLQQWVSFFLDGVQQTVQQGMETTNQIIALQKTMQEKVAGLGRRAKNGHKLVQLLFSQPIIDSVAVRKELQITASSAQQLITTFTEQNILLETTGFKRNRLYVFEDYLALLRR